MAGEDSVCVIVCQVVFVNHMYIYIHAFLSIK